MGYYKDKKGINYYKFCKCEDNEIKLWKFKDKSHKAKIVCATCDAYIKWASKQDANFILAKRTGRNPKPPIQIERTLNNHLAGVPGFRTKIKRQ
jgi:hypothetical protein